MEMNVFLVTFENFSSYAHNQVHQHKKKKKSEQAFYKSKTNNMDSCKHNAKKWWTGPRNIILRYSSLSFDVLRHLKKKKAPHACSYKRCARVRWELVTETTTG